MKYYILLASLVGLTVAAPLTGSATGSLTANNADIDIAASTKNFTAIMYLLAPDSWVNAWNEIPDEGKQCFLKTATNPANAEIYNSEDNEKIKNDLKSKCASSYDQLAKFCDQTDATMKQLPKSFTDISKSWGQQMQDLGNQYKNAGSNAATQNADAVKSMITQFAKPTGDYFNKLAALSQEDRQKLSDAFPKLQPIFSGEHSVEFLKEITQLYQTMGSGDFNPDSYKDTGKNLVNTWGSIWNEYKSRNADGLKKAGDLVGKDLAQAGDEIANQMAAKANGMFTGTFTGGAFPASASGSVSASGPMGTNTFGVIGKAN